MLSSMLHDDEKEALLTEYQMLQDEIYHRSTTHTMANSILLPSSVIIIAIAIEFRSNLNAVPVFGIGLSGFFPLFSTLLVLSSLIMGYTIRRINEFCYIRMSEIEIALGIKGHRYVYSQNIRYWRMRTAVWIIMFASALAASIVASIVLFLQS